MGCGRMVIGLGVVRRRSGERVGRWLAFVVARLLLVEPVRVEVAPRPVGGFVGGHRRARGGRSRQRGRRGLPSPARMGTRRSSGSGICGGSRTQPPLRGACARIVTGVSG